MEKIIKTRIRKIKILSYKRNQKKNGKNRIYKLVWTKIKKKKNNKVVGIISTNKFKEQLKNQVTLFRTRMNKVKCIRTS